MSRICKQLSGCENYCNQRCLNPPTPNVLKNLTELCEMMNISLVITYTYDNVYSSKKCVGVLSKNIWSRSVVSNTYEELLQNLFKILKEYDV